MAGRCGVRANRQAEWFVGHAIGAEHPGDGSLGAGGDDREIGIDGAVAGDDADHPTVLDPGNGLGLVDEVRAGLDGGVHQCGVEPTARPDGAVVRESIGGRPVELADLLAGDHPQALDAVGVVEVDLQFVQRADGPRGQTVAADLVATVGALLEHHHLRARSGCLDGRRRAGRAGADDRDVDAFGTHAYHAAGTGGEKHRRALEVVPPNSCDGGAGGVGVRHRRTMMRVMAEPVPERRSDHAADLLAIYDVAVDQVYRYHRARCGHRQVAEDLTAETFLAAVGQVRRDRVDQVTVAWLIGIARHKLVDHWRRLDRQPRRFDDPSGDVDLDVASDEWAPEVLERQHVDAVMSQLGSHHREALVLRYFDGLAVPEVAAALGRTVHATETLLVRARRQFRLLYEQAEGSAP